MGKRGGHGTTAIIQSSARKTYQCADIETAIAKALDHQVPTQIWPGLSKA